MRRYTLSTDYFKEYLKTKNNSSVNIQYLYELQKNFKNDKSKN